MKPEDKPAVDPDLTSENIDASDTRERRQQQRVRPYVLSALLVAGDERTAVSVVDISLTGARVLNAPPGIAAGDTVTLAALLHGSDTIAVPCIVMHVTGNEASSELGVRFQPAYAAEEGALRSFILAHLRNGDDTGDAAVAA